MTGDKNQEKKNSLAVCKGFCQEYTSLKLTSYDMWRYNRLECWGLGETARAASMKSKFKIPTRELRACGAMTITGKEPVEQKGPSL